MTDILTAPELSRPEMDTETPKGSPVELRDVHFGYNDAEVLHGIDLTFQAGTVNALVGPSGSGKSTIAKLIASFWDVGSGGGHLSGGECQRISIARAMLKNAPIVILDEATAYTDPENEAIIQESVARLVRGRTLIVIAHRLSTIADADQIVVVNDGRIEAAGTQAELLATCPLYQTLWSAHLASRDRAEGGADHA